MPTELACLGGQDPDVRYECASPACKKLTTVLMGSMLWFHDHKQMQYRLFCSKADALACMDIAHMNQA